MTARDTLSAARAAAKALLRSKGVASADYDARVLLSAATGLDAAALLAQSDRALRPDEAARFAALLERRGAREPLSHIIGRVGFWTLDLTVSADVLTPRPETEQVLEAALEETRDRAEGRVLDLGVGSGALLLAFLSERPGWTGVGTDASEAALVVARENAAACGLANRVGLLCSDWDDALRADDRFDFIVSNPPYIPTADIATLEPEVRDHEPRLALDGGADGLDAYRALAPRLTTRLTPHGVGVFEIGADQGAAAAAVMAQAAPGAMIRIAPDLAGRDRAVVVRLG